MMTMARLIATTKTKTTKTRTRKSFARSDESSGASLGTADGPFDAHWTPFGCADTAARLGAARAAIVRSMDGAIADVADDRASACHTGFCGQLEPGRRVLDRAGRGL